MERSLLCRLGFHDWVSVGGYLNEYELVKPHLFKVRKFRTQQCRRRDCDAARFQRLRFLDEYLKEIPNYEKTPLMRATRRRAS